MSIKSIYYDSEEVNYTDNFSNLQKTVGDDITKIDNKINETLKPLEIVVEEQSKAIDKLTEENSVVNNTNMTLIDSNLILSKHIRSLESKNDNMNKLITILKTNLTVYKRYSVCVSIIIVIETFMLLFR